MNDQAGVGRVTHEGSGSEHASHYKKDFWDTANLSFGEPWYRLQKAAGIVARLAGQRQCELLDVGFRVRLL